jgi:hypothetical protein
MHVKKLDMWESPNDSTLAGEEGHGSRGETCHPIYRENPVSSVAEHPLETGCNPDIACNSLYSFCLSIKVNSKKGKHDIVLDMKVYMGVDV